MKIKHYHEVIFYAPLQTNIPWWDLIGRLGLVVPSAQLLSELHLREVCIFTWVNTHKHSYIRTQSVSHWKEKEGIFFLPVPPPSLAYFPALHTAACISCDEKRPASNLPLKHSGDRPYWTSRAKETMCADGPRQEPQLYCHRTVMPHERKRPQQVRSQNNEKYSCKQQLLRPSTIGTPSILNCTQM